MPPPSKRGHQNKAARTTAPPPTIAVSAIRPPSSRLRRRPVGGALVEARFIRRKLAQLDGMDNLDSRLSIAVGWSALEAVTTVLESGETSPRESFLNAVAAATACSRRARHSRE